MPSQIKAILAVAGDVGAWALLHRSLLLIAAIAFVVVGQQAGVITPLDWWGTGEEIR